MKVIDLNKEISSDKVISFFLYMLIWIMPFLITSINKLGGINDDKSTMLYLITLFIIILSFKDIKKIKSLVTIVLLIYGLLVIIATIFSIDRDNALWGSFGRYEGMITILCYIVLFIASKNYMIITKKTINITLILVTLMSLLAIIQIYIYDPIYNQPTLYGVNRDIGIAATLERSMGTIGHRNFMSTYLVIFLPIAVSLYIILKEKKYLIYSIVIFIALLCTTTRSGWLSVMLFMAMILIFIWNKSNYLKQFAKVVMIFMVLVFLVNISINNVILDRTNTFKNEVIEFNEHSGSNRIKIWKNVMTCIKSHPILGTGPDTVFQALSEERNKNPNIINAAVDKAHNEFLQVALNSGIPSLCVYIVFLILIMINLLKHINDKKYKILLLVFLSFIIQSFFNISVVSVAPIVWILFGIMSKDEILIYSGQTV